MKTLLLLCLSFSLCIAHAERRLINGRTVDSTGTNWYNVVGTVIQPGAGGWIVDATIKRHGDKQSWSGRIFLRNPNQGAYALHTRLHARYLIVKKQIGELKSDLKIADTDYVEANAEATERGRKTLIYGIPNRNTQLHDDAVTARRTASENSTIINDRLSLLKTEQADLISKSADREFELYERALLTAETYQKMPVYNCGTPVR